MPDGVVSSQSCAVAQGPCNAVDDGVGVQASGTGALRVSVYAADPVAAPSFRAAGRYFDVAAAPGSTFATVTVEVCDLAGASVLYWWDPAPGSWAPVSPLSGPSGTPPCLSALLGPTSRPTIADLTGTVFALGTPGVAIGVTRVFGPTPEGTAAAELAQSFPFTKGVCPPTRTVVLAPSTTFQDGLSSQALARRLTTGTLLTVPGRLSAPSARALRLEGIREVVLVGASGSQGRALVRALEQRASYDCGGAHETGGRISVLSLGGSSPYATAMAVAERVGRAPRLAFPGAYATQDAAGGSGRYNDTSARSTPAPKGVVPTAILASGTEPQDAQAASVLSYRTALPLLLTPATSLSATAVAAMKKLGVKQVILMGGPLAVTSAVQSALVREAGVAVLRVAGKDATDTAVQLARFETARNADGLGWTPAHRILVARGDGFADSLCAGVLENRHDALVGPGRGGIPLLLTESPTVLGAPLGAFLSTTGRRGVGGASTKAITAVTVVGGPLAVSPALVGAIRTDLAGA